MRVLVSLDETPPTGEPDAGNPPVRFGGRGRVQSSLPTPITPISWNGQSAITGLPDRIRIKATFEGEQKTKVRFSALYVQHGGKS